MNNEIRFATNEDEKAVRDLWDACFDEDSKEWRDWYFRYIYRLQNTMLLFENNSLASMIQINPYTMCINNKIVKAASLAGVATYKKYRNKGYAGRLIELGLVEMQKRGIVFSFLYPFNYDYYRKFGYELCYNRKVYKVSSNIKSDYEFTQIDNTYDVTELYTKYCTGLNGYIVRDKDHMSKKLKEHLVDKNNSYIIKHNDIEVGYCMLHHGDDGLVADELIVPDIQSTASAISSVFQKPLTFESPYNIEGIDRELKLHCMGRVIDIYTLFNDTKSKKNKVNIKIVDEIIDYNNDIFIFDGMSGFLKISLTKDKPDFTLSIKELAQIGVGFKQGMSDKAFEVYNLFFEENTPWIKEVC